MYALTVHIKRCRFFFDADYDALMGNKEVNVILFPTKQAAIDFVLPKLVENREIEQTGDEYRTMQDYENDGDLAPSDNGEYILIRYCDRVLEPKNEFLYIVEVDSKIPNLKA